MVVFVTGARGFLGQRLVRALVAAGHRVVCAVRDAPGRAVHVEGPVSHVLADFARDQTPEAWLPHLAGVDAVVNAAGLFRQTRTARFADVHVRGPCALFTACAKAGVARVVQISALGADEAARSAYHLSKKEADDFLLRLPLASAAVAQPSLVYGPGARARASSRGWRACRWCRCPPAAGSRCSPSTWTTPSRRWCGWWRTLA